MHGLLAIESSQRVISVAIRCRDGSIVQRNPIGDPREKDLLLPAIIALCEDANIARGELRAIAISTGPGGFT
jgi:tRNA threonylcarbamoyladenosine biosynthesis protein TsaB